MAPTSGSPGLLCYPQEQKDRSEVLQNLNAVYALVQLPEYSERELHKEVYPKEHRFIRSATGKLRNSRLTVATDNE